MLGEQNSELRRHMGRFMGGERVVSRVVCHVAGGAIGSPAHRNSVTKKDLKLEPFCSTSRLIEVTGDAKELDRKNKR
jgi:hypothetical protein